MAIQRTYLFYDIETTGLNPCFNQVLQFAAIRTDLNLREIERHEIKVKLNPDTVIEPGALLTHRIGISTCQHGEREIDAIIQIHRLFNTPGTISLGYNTLGFDDEFLRFSFYRNLLPPYTHQFTNQCQRMDLYPITMLFYLFKPDILNQWPIETNGTVRLKLEMLNKLNNLADGPAHQAIADVEATLALAKKFMQAPEIWNYALGCFEKNIDEKRSQILQAEMALMIEGKIGAQNNFIAPVIYCGQHRHYKNQQLWLRLDTENLSNTSLENIPEHTFVFRKKLGEKEILLPAKPNYLEKISEKRQNFSAENLKWIEKNNKIWQAIKDYHCQYTYPKVPNVDAAAALYEIGFMDESKTNLFRQFHNTSSPHKLKLAEEFPEPYKELALRLIARNFPQYLSLNQYQDLIDRLLTHDRIDFRGQKKLSMADCLKQIEFLATNDLDPEQQILLADLKNYLIELPWVGRNAESVV